MKVVTLVLVVALGVLQLSAGAQKCMHPPPAPSFTPEKFQGTWYEIGKIQTWGGAIIEGSCVCTQVLIGDSTPAGLPINNSCRNKTPQGKFTNATGHLVQRQGLSAGAFEEDFSFGTKANYTIIAMDDEGEKYALEYDCEEEFFGLVENYCIHLLSRTPTFDPQLTQELFDEAISLGLNQQNLTMKLTEQTGCGWGGANVLLHPEPKKVLRGGQ